MASHPDPASPLPVALTSFIGRERELAEVRRLIGACRLLAQADELLFRAPTKLTKVEV